MNVQSVYPKTITDMNVQIPYPWHVDMQSSSSCVKVHLATAHHPQFFLRQTPQYDGIWKNLRVTTDLCMDADWLVVYDMATNVIATNVPRERRILFATEPEKLYRPDFRAQFGIVVTPRTDLSPIPDQIVLRQHCGLPWHFGKGDESQPDWQKRAISLPFLQALCPTKDRLISAITSDLTALPEHRARLAFLRALPDHGVQFDWFGKRVRHLTDKADGILPYRYHIVLENTLQPHAWTEKLADGWLGGAFLFYSGPKNIGDYFDPAAFRLIDTSDIPGSAQIIKDAIAANAYEAAIGAIKENKFRTLFEHNLFEVIRKITSFYPSIVSSADAMITGS